MIKTSQLEAETGQKGNVSGISFPSCGTSANQKTDLHVNYMHINKMQTNEHMCICTQASKNASEV